MTIAKTLFLEGMKKSFESRRGVADASDKNKTASRGQSDYRRFAAGIRSKRGGCHNRPGSEEKARIQIVEPDTR
jgi:hypothetical protein